MNEELEGYVVAPAELERLVSAATAWGVRVALDSVAPNPARYVGIFAGRNTTLYTAHTSLFAQYFTLAHLYGHQVQLTRKTREMDAVMGIVGGAPGPLTRAEVQSVYEYEKEAAALGLLLLQYAHPSGNVPLTLRCAYTRYFEADFRYLVHYIETRERGPEQFARYLRREPMPRVPLAAAPQNLVDLRQGSFPSSSVTVV